MKIVRFGFVIAALFSFCIFVGCGDEKKVSDLEKKIEELEKTLAAKTEAVVPAGKTLEAVKAKGYISVGVNEGLFGFSKPDEKGEWRGLDVDTARAVSVAVFGAPDKIKWVPLTAKTRFTALQSGEIDVLTRNATRTLTRETSLGLNFVHANYYDGQGFLIPKKLGVKSAKELDGATVCVLARHLPPSRMSPITSEPMA